MKKANVKQLGSKPFEGAFKPLKLRDRKGGDMAEWPEDVRVRELPRRKGVLA